MPKDDTDRAYESLRDDKPAAAEQCEHKSIRWNTDKAGFCCSHCGAVFVMHNSLTKTPERGIPVQCEHGHVVWEGNDSEGTCKQCGKRIPGGPPDYARPTPLTDNLHQEHVAIHLHKEAVSMLVGTELPSRGGASDPVNHPKHYTSHPSGIECINVVRHMNFNLGNVIKYCWRTDHKNGLQDLKKARWYLDDEIKRIEAEQTKTD